MSMSIESLKSVVTSLDRTTRDIKSNYQVVKMYDKGISPEMVVQALNSILKLNGQLYHISQDLIVVSNELLKEMKSNDLELNIKSDSEIKPLFNLPVKDKKKPSK